MSDTALLSTKPTIAELGRATRLTTERVKIIWAQRRLKLKTPPFPAPPPAPIVALNPPLEPFLEDQRLELRARMKSLGKAIADEIAKPVPDAQAIDRMSSAWAKHAEQERILDGRPLPGSRRPRPERAPPRPTLSEPE